MFVCARARALGNDRRTRTVTYVPVQVESRNLGVVALEVREVKVIGERLLLPREPGTDTERVSGDYHGPLPRRRRFFLLRGGAGLGFVRAEELRGSPTGGAAVERERRLFKDVSFVQVRS